MTQSQTLPASQPSVSRLNLLLLALLLVQILVLAWVYWPQGEVDAGGTPLLGELDTDSVTAMTITAEDGSALTLVNEAGSWVLADSDGFPLREDVMEPLLEKLSAVTTDRRVTETAGSHARLQVADDEFARKLELTTSEGVKTLLIGSSAGSGATHVRVAGEEATYLTSALTAFDFNAGVTNWIDALYLSIPQNEITEVKLVNANSEIELSRGAAAEEGTPGEWVLADLAEGEEVDSAAVSSLLSRVSNVRMVTPLGKSEDAAYGLGEPAAMVEVVSVDAEGGESMVTLTIGAADAAGTDYFAKSSDAEYYVTVGSFVADDLIGKARTDFVTIPEAEAAPSSE